MKLLPMHGPAGPLPETVAPGTCTPGGHPIPHGQPFIAISYSLERFDGQAVDVDDCAVLLFACPRHAPSENLVTWALRAAGIPA